MSAPSAVKLSLSISCRGFVAFFAGAFLGAAFLGGVSASRLSSPLSMWMSASEFSSSLIGVGGFFEAAFLAVVVVVLMVVCFLGAALGLGAAGAFFAGAFFCDCC